MPLRSCYQKHLDGICIVGMAAIATLVHTCCAATAITNVHVNNALVAKDSQVPISSLPNHVFVTIAKNA